MRRTGTTTRNGGLALAMALAVSSGCDTTNAMCVAEHDVVETDEDLGGFTVEQHAAQRTASFPLVDADGVTTMLELRTVALGPVDVEREIDCTDAVSYTTGVELSLRSADGRIELDLEGLLVFDGVFGGGLSLEVDRVSMAQATAGVALPMRVGATDTVVGVDFELSGYDGSGEIVWVLANGSTAPAATLEVPWSAVIVET